MAVPSAGVWGPQPFTDTAGNAYVGSLTVYTDSGRTTKATLYTDQTKGTTASNPVASDALGNVTFYANAGLYYGTFVSGLVTVNTVHVVTHWPLDVPILTDGTTNGGTLTVGTSAPGSPGPRDIWVDTSSAPSLSELASPTSAFSMGGEELQSVGTPLSGTSAVRLQDAPPVRKPSDIGWITWNFDPVNGPGNSYAPSSGHILLVRVRLNAVSTITNVQLDIKTGGSTLTASQNWVALYPATAAGAGSLIATSADQTTAWASTGAAAAAMTAVAGQSLSNLAIGDYFVVICSNGTTPPAFVTGLNRSGIINGQISLYNSWWAQATNTATTAPTSGTLATLTGGVSALSDAIWVALY